MSALVPTLETLAARINESHQRCQDAFKQSLLHARETGELLVQAKQQVKHGEWLPWLEANCPIPERTVQAYMKVAREWQTIEAKSATVADLGLRDALLLLAPGKDAQEKNALIEHEESIDLWVEYLREMGKSLKTVRDKKLYRERYETFDAYCLGRWDMQPSLSRLLINGINSPTLLREWLAAT